MLIFYLGGATDDSEMFCAIITGNWCDIVNSIRDTCVIDFANQLLQAGLIQKPAFDTAIDSQSGQPTKTRVTQLLSSALEAIKHEKRHFEKLCEIVREVGDSAVADNLLRQLSQVL